MGLTIHYRFNAGSRSTAEIKQIIKELHLTALELAFESLEDV